MEVLIHNAYLEYIECNKWEVNASGIWASDQVLLSYGMIILWNIIVDRIPECIMHKLDGIRSVIKDNLMVNPPSPSLPHINVKPVNKRYQTKEKEHMVTHD